LILLASWLRVASPILTPWGTRPVCAVCCVRERREDCCPAELRSLDHSEAKPESTRRTSATPSNLWGTSLYGDGLRIRVWTKSISMAALRSLEPKLLTHDVRKLRKLSQGERWLRKKRPCRKRRKSFQGHGPERTTGATLTSHHHVDSRAKSFGSSSLRKMPCNHDRLRIGTMRFQDSARRHSLLKRAGRVCDFGLSRTLQTAVFKMIRRKKLRLGRRASGMVRGC
jgi:hypothetical protein